MQRFAVPGGAVDQRTKVRRKTRRVERSLVKGDALKFGRQIGLLPLTRRQQKRGDEKHSWDCPRKQLGWHLWGTLAVCPLAGSACQSLQSKPKIASRREALFRFFLQAMANDLAEGQSDLRPLQTNLGGMIA